MRTELAAVLAAGGIACWPANAMLERVGGLATRGGRKSPRAADPESECLTVLESTIVLLQAGTPAGPALALATESLRTANSESAEGWRMLAAAARGEEDVASVWRQLGERWGCPTFVDVAAAWRMSSRYGSPLTTALEAAVGGIRARRRHRGSIDGAVAGARATMTVLTCLPIIGVGLGLLLGVDMFGVYFGASGLVTLWPGLFLLLCGRRWASALVRRALTSDDVQAVSA